METKNRLKELRKASNFSQKDFFENIVKTKLKLDVTLRTYQNWENPNNEIKSKPAQALADFFGVPVGYLLGYDKEDILEKVIEFFNNIDFEKLSETYPDYETLEKISKAYTEIENYIDNPLKYEKFGKGLTDVNQSYILIIQKLIESDKEFGTNFADVLINYISLNNSDKLIVFDLIQKMANKDT